MTVITWIQRKCSTSLIIGNLLIAILKICLSLKQIIEVLMLIESGNKMKTQQEVCDLFNNK